MGDDVEVLVHRACQTSSKAYGRSVFGENYSTRRAKLQLLSPVAQLLGVARYSGGAMLGVFGGSSSFSRYSTPAMQPTPLLLQNLHGPNACQGL